MLKDKCLKDVSIDMDPYYTRMVKHIWESLKMEVICLDYWTFFKAFI